MIDERLLSKYEVDEAGEADKAEAVEAAVVEAAWFIHDGFDGLERAHPSDTSKPTLRALHLHLAAMPLVQVVRCLFVALSFFERPWWLAGADARAALDRGAFPLGGLPYLAGSTSTACEAALLAMLCADFALQWRYESWARMVERKWPAVTAVLLVATAVQQAVTAGGESVVAPLLRVAILVCADWPFSLAIRRQLNLLAHICYRTAGLAALSFLTIGFFAWAAAVGFAGTGQASQAQPGGGAEFSWAFGSYGEAAWALLVLFTTANNPDVAMPAINAHRAAAVFFAVFVLLAAFVEANLWLAAVYHEYVVDHERLHLAVVRVRERSLAKAFAALVSAPPHLRRNSAVCLRAQASKRRVFALFRELNRYHDISFIDDSKARLLFAMLDKSGDGAIQQREFVHLCDLLHIEFCRARGGVGAGAGAGAGAGTGVGLGRVPWGWFVRAAAGSPRFEAAVDAVVALNMASLVGETWQLLVDSRAPLDVEALRLATAPVMGVIACLFCLEFVARVAALPWVILCADLLARYEAAVTLATAGLACVLGTPAWHMLSPARRDTCVRAAILLRSARAPRLLRRLPPLRRLTHAFALVAEAAASLSTMLVTCMYVFAALGVALFGGRVRTDAGSWQAQALEGSDYGGGGRTTGYYACNFNDMASGMLTLFQLLVANNWTVFADGFVAVSSVWARVYFIAYYVFSRIVVFNVVVAVVLSAFDEQLGNDGAGNGTSNGGSAGGAGAGNGGGLHARRAAGQPGDEAGGAGGLRVVSRNGGRVTEEALVRRNRAEFDAAQITGTTTGLHGRYRAVLPRAWGLPLTMFSGLP
eukprot:g5471.t1